jgi:hypothetical protein
MKILLNSKKPINTVTAKKPETQCIMKTLLISKKPIKRNHNKNSEKTDFTYYVHVTFRDLEENKLYCFSFFILIHTFLTLGFLLLLLFHDSEREKFDSREMRN